ncbi:expressed unknown protein [Seminavis robusta]|uniref:Uncharacterized protein n=1 Tax=Seminavis robusta TaxID=568900 RepID=A0A9N8ECT4_9STRA|nr:expressed unknown protein [Seminavis robusta]|eukprot:Sro961_g224920.1 n/a (510) ;mRNA; r:2407-4035
MRNESPALRRKQQEMAYRLRARPPAPDTDERHQRRRQQSRWNGNGQGATNDSDEFKASVRIVDGFPVEYSCRDDPRQKSFQDDANLTKISINFDYEMVTMKNARVLESIRSLEWSLLWNVARNMGLHNCNYRKQEPLSDGERHLSSENYVVGLSSLELDDVDHNIDKCTFLTSPQKGLVCTPMVGRMTAHFIGDKSTIRSYLEHNIKKELNSKRVQIEQVKECHFVGDRSSLLQPLANVREELHSRSSTMNLALVFGAIAAAIVLSLAILMARGRKSRRRQHTLDDDAALPNLPSVLFQKPMQGQAIDIVRHSCSSDTQESLPPAESNIIACETLDDDLPLGNREIVIPSIPLPASTEDGPLFIDDQPMEVKAPAEETPDTTTSEDKENMGVPPLPALKVVPVDDQKPKDPMAKSKTLQPKRKRRKKKKKKQRVLKRTSSRNSIDEMETIREDDESVDDEGSEFDGSEYSTDDEESPFSSNLDDEQDVVVPPSPILEEKRIRRLPPPWI